MTAGKSEVGQALADRTGLAFVDLDSRITEYLGTSIAEVFEAHGEVFFREVESRILAEACQRSGQILSCGGGTFLSSQNRKLLGAQCETVWLKVSAQTVLRRLAFAPRGERPLLAGPDRESVVQQLLGQRMEFYARADHAFQTDDRTVEEVAAAIQKHLKLPEASTEGPTPDPKPLRTNRGTSESGGSSGES